MHSLIDERHLALRPATPNDVPAIVALHRGLAPAPAPAPDASPVDWFRAGGPCMHEHFCARHIQQVTRPTSSSNPIWRETLSTSRT